LAAAIDAIRPGVTASSVDMAANAAIEELGAGPSHFHRTGYSVGLTTSLYWPEGHIVSLRQNDPTLIEEDMVFHLPMTLYRPDIVGAGISETVRVTDSGVEVLTGSPRELLIV
jgi:Xaa-Pro aminopeptidase